MTTLHLTIPTDLENELSRLQIDPELVAIKAIRQYISSNISVATEHDMESAAAKDNADEYLTTQELNYYLAL